MTHKRLDWSTEMTQSPIPDSWPWLMRPIYHDIVYLEDIIDKR